MSRPFGVSSAASAFALLYKDPQTMGWLEEHCLLLTCFKVLCIGVDVGVAVKYGHTFGSERIKGEVQRRNTASLRWITRTRNLCFVHCFAPLQRAFAPTNDLAFHSSTCLLKLLQATYTRYGRNKEGSNFRSKRAPKCVAVGCLKCWFIQCSDLNLFLCSDQR